MFGTRAGFPPSTRLCFGGDRPKGNNPAPGNLIVSNSQQLVERKQSQFFFGRGEKPNMSKAFEAYSWAAKRGCAEAMYMTAWMYRVGSATLAADSGQCQLWLERAVEKGYAPAMNDLAATLLGEADRIERAHPELKADVADDVGADTAVDTAGADAGSIAGSTKRRRPDHDGDDDDDDDQGTVDEDDGEARLPTGEDVGKVVDGEGDGLERTGSLPPELARLFEQVMEKRKRSMQLLQDAAKTGHTEVRCCLVRWGMSSSSCCTPFFIPTLTFLLYHPPILLFRRLCACASCCCR